MSIYGELVAAGRVLDAQGELAFTRIVEECYRIRRHRECASDPDGKPVRIACIDLLVSESMYHYLRSAFKRMLAVRYGPGAVELTYREVASDPVTMFGLTMTFTKFEVNELGCAIAIIFLDGFPLNDTDIAAVDFSDIPLFADTVIHPERHLIFSNVKSVRI